MALCIVLEALLKHNSELKTIDNNVFLVVVVLGSWQDAIDHIAIPWVRLPGRRSPASSTRQVGTPLAFLSVGPLMTTLHSLIAGRYVEVWQRALTV